MILMSEDLYGKQYATSPFSLFFIFIFILFFNVVISVHVCILRVIDCYIQDNNTGLVFQVMEKFRSAAILRLGRSFAALTVSDVAAHVSLSSISTKEMESFLASLITFGVMNATLFHSCDKSSKTTLRFLMKTSGLSAAQELRAHKRLLQEAHLLRVLVDNIMQSNHVLELSSEHIEDLRKTQRRVENGAKGNSDMPIGGEVSEFDFDEDMMGDLH